MAKRTGGSVRKNGPGEGHKGDLNRAMNAAVCNGSGTAKPPTKR